MGYFTVWWPIVFGYLAFQGLLKENTICSGHLLGYHVSFPECTFHGVASPKCLEGSPSVPSQLTELQTVMNYVLRWKPTPGKFEGGFLEVGLLSHALPVEGSNPSNYARKNPCRYGAERAGPQTDIRLLVIYILHDLIFQKP